MGEVEYINEIVNSSFVELCNQKAFTMWNMEEQK